MSFVTTQPEALSTAATALGGIGSSFSSQNAAAAAPTAAVKKSRRRMRNPVSLIPGATYRKAAKTCSLHNALMSLFRLINGGRARTTCPFYHQQQTSSGRPGRSVSYQ